MERRAAIVKKDARVRGVAVEKKEREDEEGRAGELGRDGELGRNGDKGCYGRKGSDGERSRDWENCEKDREDKRGCDGEENL